MPKDKKFDLEERTGKFGENTIDFCKKVPRGPVTDPIISQAVRSGTSVGANYCEADCAETRKDFEHKIGICKKESRESKHWFRMLAKTTPELKESARILWQEANELNLIFTSIVKKSRLSNISDLKLGN
ncbi:MAG TPA: four helix bundle protein [Candidatus Eisenbacteria bacterium]|nr:four helix bundle protein [Candidatus Eisenbacteria bacterium]